MGEVLFVLSYIALWVITMLLVAAVFILYHHFGETYINTLEGRTSQGPKLDESIKPFDLWDAHGAPIHLGVAGTSKLVIFASTSCKPCTDLLPLIPSFAALYSWMQIVFICRGSRQAVLDFSEALSPSALLVVDEKGELAKRFNVLTTPFAFVVDHAGIVRGTGVAHHWENLEWFAQ